MWRNGSRARLRIWWRKPWGFESPHPHKATSEGDVPSFFFVTIPRNAQVLSGIYNINHITCYYAIWTDICQRLIFAAGWFTTLAHTTPAPRLAYTASPAPHTAV